MGVAVLAVAPCEGMGAGREMGGRMLAHMGRQPLRSLSLRSSMRHTEAGRQRACADGSVCVRNTVPYPSPYHTIPCAYVTNMQAHAQAWCHDAPVTHPHPHSHPGPAWMGQALRLMCVVRQGGSRGWAVIRDTCVCVHPPAHQ